MTELNDLSSKARYWNLILYPENLVEKYKTIEDVSDVIGLPFAYCVHDKDKDGHDGDRKTHAHVLVAYGNTTTGKSVYERWLALSKPGTKLCLPPVPCGDVRHSYEYLIHNTPNAKKKKKHLYGTDERILCNNFDIGVYEQVSQEEKDEIAQQLCDFALDHKIEDMAEFYDRFRNAEEFRELYNRYFSVLKSVNAMVDRICRGNQYQARREREIMAKRKADSKPKCFLCESPRVYAQIETKDGYLWYCQECAESVYTVLLAEEEKEKEKDGEEV